MNVDATGSAAAGAAPAGDGELGAAGGAYAVGADGAGDVHVISMDHGASLTSDVALFGDALGAAGQLETPVVSPVLAVAMEPLGAIDREAAALGENAKAASESGNELTPGEILDLTVRSQEFMFHSQLTSNIANRTAEGLQQLFRQQG